MKQIGATETFDPCFVFDWDERLLEANIIITKELSDDMIYKVLANTDKIILHHTVTGQGGTWMEPGVKSIATEFNQFKKLISLGFPLDHYVLRVDPIIPVSKESIQRFESVLETWNTYLKEIDKKIRCRISMIDLYNHVIDRFRAAKFELPWREFHAPQKAFDFVKTILVKYSQFNYQSCAEYKFDKELVSGTSCADFEDIKILNLNWADYGALNLRRPLCNCLFKKQILKVRPTRCPHECIYCYWKDTAKESRVVEYNE